MKKLMCVFLLLFVPLSSQALFEARIGYGVNSFDEDTYVGNDLDKMSGFNLDFIFEPPLITDLGIGLRYEKMKFDINSAPAAEGKLDRISLLVNYRVIDLLAYFGPIATISLTNKLDVESGGASTELDDKINFTIGAEGGVSLGLIQVGAEVGKFFGKFENPGAPDLDLSSFYGKIIVGVGF